jgi:Sulfotransferase family
MTGGPEVTAAPPSRARRPILIIGTERSGSNLLRLILNSHSAVAIPHPPHLMRFLAPIAASYGDLTVEENRLRLARDAALIVRRHIQRWEHSVDVHGVVESAPPSVFGTVSAFYEQYRIAEGKETWGCKSTFNIDHVAEVRAVYPEACFVWLVRDPRDVALSATRSVFGYSHPYRMAGLWREQQERGFAALEAFGPETVLLMHYEDLVTEPEPQLRTLCSFAGLNFEPQMLQHHRSPAAKTLAAQSASWRNAASPINAASVGKHCDGLSAAARGQVEHAAGSTMTRLGYRPASPSQLAVPPSRVGLWGGSALRRLRIEYNSLRRDANHWRRWNRDATVLWLRLRRGTSSN